jgi:NCAIR mutase (PurE)-related protein
MHRNFVALLLAIASGLAAAPVVAVCTGVKAYLYNLGGLTAEASMNFLAYEGTFTVYAK